MCTHIYIYIYIYVYIYIYAKVNRQRKLKLTYACENHDNGVYDELIRLARD